MAETFGQTGIGPNETSLNAGFISAHLHTSGSAGDLCSISVYAVPGFNEGERVKCAIYHLVVATWTFLASTEEKLIPIGGGWITFNFPSPPTVLATTQYRLCVWPGDFAIRTVYFAGAANQNMFHTKVYDDWPATLTLTGGQPREYSIFATYCENLAPTAPTGQQVDGQSSPTGANCISNLTPGFSAVYNDPDAGDISNAINIQVGTASGLSDMWDSGWLADSTVTPNRCTAKTYAGAALSTGTSYWWRCRFRDDDNAEGAWSEWQQFDICEEVPAEIPLQCVPGGPLPRRRPFACAVQVPLMEPSRRFPFEFPIPRSPCN